MQPGEWTARRLKSGRRVLHAVEITFAKTMLICAFTLWLEHNANTSSGRALIATVTTRV